MNVNNKRKNSGFFSKIKHFLKTVRRIFRTNIVISKTFFWSLAILLLVFSIVGGLIRKDKVQTERALTLSDINQEISFTQTDVKVTLEKQKRYKDMTIIPLSFESSDSQSLDAKDYHIALLPQDGKELPNNIRISLASFNTTGKMAIVIKGQLKKEPIQVILKNKSNYLKDESSKEGYLTIWGRDTEVDYNGIAFTINPKGNNVNEDKRISEDMLMKDLYLASFGDNEISKLDDEKTNKEKEKNVLTKKLEEYERRVQQLNKALKKDKNDFMLTNTTTSNDESISNVVENYDYNNVGESKLSSSDLESLRNENIRKVEQIKSNISDKSQEIIGIEKQKSTLNDTIERMNDLTTLSSDYQILEN
ncbi:hypothetical protein [Staphylococcus hyicus]|uniref:coiled-coil domain-containing protein n=1 Tax=Staphylococcus hyicus TaxID=1284 RepID=UPI0031333140